MTMPVHHSKPSELMDWNQVPVSTWDQIPVSTEKETLANQATYIYHAETTLSEKIQRVFNASMFALAGIKILTFIPGISTIGLKLGGMAFTALGGASLIQLPTVIAIAALASKIIFTLAFITVIRKIIAIVIFHIVYPAVKKSYHLKEQIDKDRLEAFNSLNGKNFECRRIVLNKSGINYDAFAIKNKAIENDKWAVVAGGNLWFGERTIEFCAEEFSHHGFNVLYVNGPGVGRSTGFPTSYSIGAGQEAGLQFLEKAVQAKTILLFGTSLGGGAQSEAILSHPEFKKEINYIVWSDRTFDTLSQIVSHTTIRFAKIIFFLLGIELNGVAAAKKLQKLGIPHIVTQNNQSDHRNEVIDVEGSDSVIPNATSLYVGVRRAGIQDSKRIKFHLHPEIDHVQPLPWNIQLNVHDDIANFVKNPLPRA